MTRSSPADAILARVADAHNLEPRDLRGREVSRRLTHARRAAAKALRESGLTVREVGDALGGRSHTDVLSLLRGAKALPHRVAVMRLAYIAAHGEAWSQSVARGEHDARLAPKS